MVRSIDRAEELAQDALVIALAEWPKTGVPANPGAWLMTTAKRRAIDAIRRDRMRERKHEEIAREMDGAGGDAVSEAAMDDDPGDELLGLIFTACHPILSSDARAALTLRVIGGLTTDEIARAFLTGEPTIAQRIVRRGFLRCWRSSTSSSMKATPQRPATISCGRACAWRRNGWDASSRG
jgi:RNA polymerase sigma factor (sigma-70 family)